METIYALFKNLAVAGYLPDGFEHAFMVRGMIAALILGPLLGGIGTLVVSRKLAFYTQTIGHASLTGVALGLLFGEPLGETYAGLYGFSLLVALLMLYIKNRSGAASDTVVGVILAQTLGVGIIMLVLVTKQFDVHQIEAMLFGSLLTITEQDLLILAIIALISLVVLLVLFNSFLLLCFNSALAKVRGARPVLTEYVFVCLTTIVVVSSLKLIGALLVLALIVVPAAAANNLAKGVAGYFWYSVLFATFSMVLGLMLSNYWTVPTGAAIVLFSAGLFYLSLVSGSFNKPSSI
jgi:zinc transport system permease protein